ncbi:unnamed protein product [Cuscuta epithymum]|uniref:Uncharacterized protein n=1 Tax=Cuscuta epithymum TaxID=186058 RepID=A0AAV0ED06_9ASTE|nr:unnamed protein product [Cuscuta epithymum]
MMKLCSSAMLTGGESKEIAASMADFMQSWKGLDLEEEMEGKERPENCEELIEGEDRTIGDLLRAKEDKEMLIRPPLPLLNRRQEGIVRLGFGRLYLFLL